MNATYQAHAAVPFGVLYRRADREIDNPFSLKTAQIFHWAYLIVP
jgi:hypothetical protein